MEDHISSPRPLYDRNEVSKGTKRFSMGSTSAGIIMDASKNGLIVNGYYKGLNNDTEYACVRDPVFISWKEFEKIKESVLKPKTTRKRKKSKGVVPDRVDVPDDAYLKTLPLVTINGFKYYIDGDKRERRPFDAPKNVFKF